VGGTIPRMVVLGSIKKQIDPFLSPCTNLNTKWIKDLHIKPETLKFIVENVGTILEDMGTGEKYT
jgi:hypothetical protein